MAVYAIGDVHGCFASFQQLLKKINFSPRADKLWLVGDVVNRGAQSLQMLRWLRQHEESVVLVLGNHDLHLLALYHGIGERAKHPTLAPLWEAADKDELCTWLQRQPLAHYEHGYLMVHAGVAPQWDLSQTLAAAAEVQTQLRMHAGGTTKANAEFFATMYGNEPNAWRDELQPPERWRVSINALTRLRICTAKGKMLLTYTGTREQIPHGYDAWFAAPQRRTVGTPIIFGHWSALGVIQSDNIIALDSGCLWGGALSAVRLDDGKLFQVKCGDDVEH